jgi:SPP1 gp7 family putative phage head morphogenesis protein
MFLDELNKSIKSGITYETFKSTIDTLLLDKGYSGPGARRLDTIYRTNLQASYMAGRWQQMKEVTDDFPYWEFVAVADNRTTEGCRGLDGVILPVDAEFWKKNFPPRHYMCRSRTRAISEQMLSDRGRKPDDPKKFNDIEPAEGFDNSPADEWKPDLGKYAPDIRKDLKKVLEDN